MQMARILTKIKKRLIIMMKQMTYSERSSWTLKIKSGLRDWIGALGRYHDDTTDPAAKHQVKFLRTLVNTSSDRLKALSCATMSPEMSNGHMLAVYSDYPMSWWGGFSPEGLVRSRLRNPQTQSLIGISWYEFANFQLSSLRK